jgi:hypothetical protein
MSYGDQKVVRGINVLLLSGTWRHLALTQPFYCDRPYYDNETPGDSTMSITRAGIEFLGAECLHGRLGDHGLPGLFQ